MAPSGAGVGVGPTSLALLSRAGGDPPPPLGPAPTVTSIAPTSGAKAGGQAVTVTGTGFTSGPGLAVSIGGVAATSVTWVSATSITCVTPASSSSGAKAVTVTNPDGQTGTLAGGYTYLADAPTVTAISPTSGSQSGGTAVTITGTGFVNGATAAIDGVACTGVTWVSATSLTATTPAGASTGAKNVTVTNPDAQTGTLTGGFSYTASGPTVTSISPTSGSKRGGTTVVIAGTNFGGGSTVTIDGVACTGIVVDSSTQITCVTAAMSSFGAKDVVVTSGSAATLTGGFTSDFVAASYGTVERDINPTSAATTRDGSNKISAISDSSGNGRGATQATAANQPTWISSDASFNNKPVISNVQAANPNQQWLNLAAFGITAPAGADFFLVAKKNVDAEGSHAELWRLAPANSSREVYGFTDGHIYTSTGSTARRTMSTVSHNLALTHVTHIKGYSNDWDLSLNGASQVLVTGAAKNSNTPAYHATPTLGYDVTFPTNQGITAKFGRLLIYSAMNASAPSRAECSADLALYYGAP